MTIKNLWKFLTDRNPDIFEMTKISNLSGYRVGIDANNWIYKRFYNSISQNTDRTNILFEELNENKVNETLLMDIFRRICDWVEVGITPIFVFDGEAPPEKLETKAGRINSRQKYENELDEIMTDYGFKRYGCWHRKEKNVINNYDKGIEAKVKRLMKNTMYPTSDSYELIKCFLSSLGIPVITGSRGMEAERIVSIMCKNNIIVAAISTDGDCLAHKCPVTIREDNTRYLPTNKSSASVINSYLGYVEIVRYHNVIKNLQLSEDDFVDLCICSGCDYNTNIAGIAITSVYKFLNGEINGRNKKFNREEDCIRYKQCKELFKEIPLSECFENNCTDNVYNINFVEDPEQALENFNLEFLIDRYIRMQKKYIEPKNFIHTKYEYLDSKIMFSWDKEKGDKIPELETYQPEKFGKKKKK